MSCDVANCCIIVLLIIGMVVLRAHRLTLARPLVFQVIHPFLTVNIACVSFVSAVQAQAWTCGGGPQRPHGR